jgi:hypothetical protein
MPDEETQDVAAFNKGSRIFQMDATNLGNCIQRKQIDGSMPTSC